MFAARMSGRGVGKHSTVMKFFVVHMTVYCKQLADDDMCTEQSADDDMCTKQSTSTHTAQIGRQIHRSDVEIVTLENPGLASKAIG